MLSLGAVEIYSGRERLFFGNTHRTRHCAAGAELIIISSAPKHAAGRRVTHKKN